MIKYGFQTYTWQMSYEKYAGRMDHIADITNRCGLNIIEAEICMLKDYFENPEKLRQTLAEKNVGFGALCLVCDWLRPDETDEERALADKAIKFTGCFENLMLVLGQMPQKDRSELKTRQKNALACINNVAKRAYNLGVPAVYHPNSPAGSAFRILEDYKILTGGLDGRYVGLAPDSGHIIKGGMDVYDIFRDYIDIIKHVHFKDIDDINNTGEWRLMGDGITDFAKIIKILGSGGYNGYVMIEDESPEAEVDPDAAVLKNAEYIKKYLK